MRPPREQPKHHQPCSASPFTLQEAWAWSGSVAWLYRLDGPDTVAHVRQTRSCSL
jgi:hypothetical protein